MDKEIQTVSWLEYEPKVEDGKKVVKISCLVCKKYQDYIKARWISHKLNAFKRVLSKYVAYTNHLVALSIESNVKSTDRTKMKGYYTKWTVGKYLLGCALFIDLLTPCSIFSKEMQSDDVDILSALNSLLRSIKEIDKLSSKSLDQWPTYVATLKKVS